MLSFRHNSKWRLISPHVTSDSRPEENKFKLDIEMERISLGPVLLKGSVQHYIVDAFLALLLLGMVYLCRCLGFFYPGHSNKLCNIIFFGKIPQKYGGGGINVIVQCFSIFSLDLKLTLYLFKLTYFKRKKVYCL